MKLITNQQSTHQTKQLSKCPHLNTSLNLISYLRTVRGEVGPGTTSGFQCGEKIDSELIGECLGFGKA